MMAETQLPPSAPHSLPPPATLAARPHLPPPSHLEPLFVPQSPQVRPRYSDLPTRTPYTFSSRQSPYEQASQQDFRALPQVASPPGRSPDGSGFPHPPLYPQRVSYQSTNPGTLYEALSPVDYSTHGPPPEASLFNEGGYMTTSPYPTANLQQHQSPASSYHSSATSSSGITTGQMPFARPGPNLEAHSSTTATTPDM